MKTGENRGGENEGRRARRVNECMAAMGFVRYQEWLFGDFWRERELTILFGPPGTGKSVLAVQLADEIARGRGIEGFAMPMYRRKVLYVDLVHSGAQFRMRYMYDTGVNREKKCYRFSESLYRDRPERAEDLCVWLRERIDEDGFQVVIVDDLSAIKVTQQGTRETLRAMRELKKLGHETGVSILVVAGATEPRRNGLMDEACLGRSRVLCDLADRVFAIGPHPRSAADRYLIQTRSRNAPMVWNAQNAPVCRMGRMESGMLGFVFDGRFADRIDEETRKQISTIKAMREAGATFRTIAKALGIGVSQVHRLYRKWTPEMHKGFQLSVAGSQLSVTGGQEGSGQQAADTNRQSDKQEEWDEAGYEKPEWLEGITDRLKGDAADRGGGDAADRIEGGAEGREVQPEGAEVGADLRLNLYERPAGPRSVYDLKRGLNGYGHEIFIEDEQGSPGKPRVWYEFNKQGMLMKGVRKGDVVYRNLGKGPYF